MYEPEKENPPGEAMGAASCSFVDENGELADQVTCTHCGAPGEALRGKTAKN
ncbi:MAG: rubredoxin [Thermoanaerobacteraceae bacterium]|nr:rubredoxin [Thermoanaerobacteraceae bacterium]